MVRKNKQAICNKILELVDTTEEEYAIEKIVYRKGAFAEYVDVYFTWQLDLSEPRITVNVSANSDMALIKNVFNAIYQEMI